MDGRFLTAGVLALSLGLVFEVMLLLAGATQVRLPLPPASIWAMGALATVNLALATFLARDPDDEAAPRYPWGSPQALLSLPVAAVLLIVAALVAWGARALPPAPALEDRPIPPRLAR